MIFKGTAEWLFYELFRLLSENKIDEDCFYSQIAHMNFADYRLHYCKARNDYKNKDCKAALSEITISLDLLAESSKIPDFGVVINMPTLMFPMPDSSGQWYIPNVSVATPADVYFSAGEINAVLVDESVSLQYYKMYLAEKSKIENYSSLNSLLSFRSSRNLQYLLDDLSNNRITVTRPSRMNDPMDSLFNIWRQQFRDVCSEKEHTEILRRAFDYFRIRSFADNSDGQMIGNHAMWAHYANSHRGCCVEYDFSGVQLSGSFRKVHYAKTAPHIAGEKSLNSDVLAIVLV